MKETLEILANWWAEQFCSSKPNWDNGDKSMMGQLTSMLANNLAISSREGITPEQRENFKSIFVDRALEYHAQNGALPQMSVDYSPSVFLREVANEAGISKDAFPCKSYSTIIDGKPFASCGYGSAFVDLSEFVSI